MQPKQRATRNIINKEEIESYVVDLVGDHELQPHVRKWWYTTFSRWLQFEFVYARTVCYQRELTTPMAHLVALMAKKLQVGDIHELFYAVKPSPDLQWLETAWDNGDTVYYVDLPSLVVNEDSELSPYVNQWRHMLDYSMTLPEREIRMSYEQMMEGTAKWDAERARQKLKGTIEEGTELVETDVFNSYSKPVVLVELKTRQAFQNEGTAMYHCVGSYWGRKNCRIFSVRGEDGPIVTIEITNGSVRQMQGYDNKAFDPALRQLIREWYANAGFKNLAKKAYDPSEDDEPDDEDCEEEEEEPRPRRRLAMTAQEVADSITERVKAGLHRTRWVAKDEDEYK